MANSGGIRLCPTPFNELEITLPLGGSAKPGRERSLKLSSGETQGSAPSPDTRASCLTLPEGG